MAYPYDPLTNWIPITAGYGTNAIAGGGAQYAMPGAQTPQYPAIGVYRPNLTSGYTDGGAGLPGMVISADGTSYQDVVNAYGYNGLAGGGSQMPQIGMPGTTSYQPVLNQRAANTAFVPPPVAAPTPMRPAMWNGPVGTPPSPMTPGRPY